MQFNNATRNCPVCNEEIKGRRDKKFCGDQCRNEYNNYLNRDENAYMKTVNRNLRKNRRILKELNPNDKSKTTRKILNKKGFNFDLITGMYKTKQGKTYYFCYEYGYLPLENDYFALVKRKEYLD